jgi:hypothetical protein
MTMDPHHRALIVKDVADAPMLRICLRDALAELEVAILASGTGMVSGARLS